MSRTPFFPMYHDAFLAKTRFLTRFQAAHYSLLLICLYNSGKPRVSKQLARKWLGMKARDFDRMIEALVEQGEMTDDGSHIYQQHVARRLSEMETVTANRVKGGIKSRKSRDDNAEPELPGTGPDFPESGPDFPESGPTVHRNMPNFSLNRPNFSLEAENSVENQRGSAVSVISENSYKKRTYNINNNRDVDDGVLVIGAWHDAIAKVFGAGARPMPTPNDLHTARSILASGVTLEQVQAVAEGVLRRMQEPPRSLAYLARVLEANPPAPVSKLRDDIVAAAMVWIGGGPWDVDRWGPSPDSPDCRCDADRLRSWAARPSGRMDAERVRMLQQRFGRRAG